MIDSDQVLENAQETGYRLCSTGKLEEDDTIFINDEEDLRTKRIFSAQFDANNSNRLFVCTQDGQLRVYTLGQNEAPNTYRILFRHCISSFDTAAGEQGVPIYQHWDKMLTIPDRPHEVIFLLGVTKTLMYTALPGITGPYPEDPFLANTTRCDFKEYIYGTPVMELWSHESRITAIAVSQFGHILASGDESGKVKLLLLRLLDDLSISLVADAKSNKKKHAPPVFEANRPEYKITLPLSNSPIFSLQFLPLVCEFTDSAATRVYCLATGTTDRVIRLWKIKCSTREGLGIYPLLSLDILLTNVLSLTCSLEENIFMEGDHRLINYMDKLKNGKKTAAEIAGKRKQKFKILGKDNYELYKGYGMVPCNIYLAGGTNFGSVYLWKFDFNTVVNMITEETNKIFNDDGSYLHSLVQSSDRPIIHLALTTAADRYDYEDVITIDTPIIEILHKYSARTKRVVVAVADMIGVVRAHGEIEMLETDDDDDAEINFSSNASLSSSKRNRKKNVLALIGESVYDSVVVGCSFKTHNIFEEIHGSSKLFVCTSDNIMQLFRSDALTALQRPGPKKIIDDHYDQVDATWTKAGTYSGAPIGDGFPIPTVRPQRSNIFDKHHEIPYATPEIYPQLSSLAYKEDDKDSIPNSLPPKMTLQTIIDRKVVGSKSDVMSMSRKDADDVTVKSIPITIKDEQSQRPSITGIAKRDIMKNDQRAFDNISVITDTRTELSRAEKESVYTTKTAKTSKTVLPKEPDAIKFEEANSEISTSPKKVDNKVLVMDAMKQLELKKKERAEKKKEEKAKEELTESEYLQPKVNSSKGAYDQLMEIQRELDNDMISVTTIDTCSTDRREAAKLVDMAMDERRYKELKPFVDPSDIPRSRVKKLPPQIDPAWKKRQEDTAPSKEDLEKLYKPDLLVQLKLKFNKENNKSSNNKKKVNDELKLEFNSSTLLPEFSMVINTDDIFGPIDGSKSWQIIEKEMDTIRDNNYCNRRSLY